MILFLAIFYYFESQNLRQIESIQRDKIEDAYHKNLSKHLRDHYALLLRVFVDDEIKRALVAKDRAALQVLTAPLYAKAQQRDPYLEVLHYHCSDGTSLLRLHRIDLFGDPIAKTRNYIASVHEKHETLYGFEEGITRVPLYRVIEPLFWEGRYIGAVEIGASPQKILDLVTNFDAIEGAITFFDAKRPVIFENISDARLFEHYNQSLTTKTPLQPTLKLAQKIYKFYAFPIEDFYGRVIGEFVFFYDFTRFYDDYYRTLLTAATLSLLLFGAMVLLIHLLTKRYERMLQLLYQRTQTILDTQSDIVIVTDGKEIVEVNQRFLSLLGYPNLDAFKKEHTCICELFMQGEGLISKHSVNDLWTQYLLQNSRRENIAKIERSGLVFTFSLFAQKLNEEEVVVTMQNITVLKSKERSLKENLKLVDQNLLISSTDLEGNITYVSKAFIRTTGYAKEALLGQNHRIIKHPDMPAALYHELWGTIIHNRVWQGELKSRTKTGETFWSRTWIHPKYDELGVKIGYTAVRHDITDKKRLEAISITDALTDLYNRRRFDALLPELLSAAKRRNDLLCFAIMDIDYFKRYNDTYGHQQGDEALKKVAQAIQACLKRGDDYAFRLGGEEFGVVFKSESPQKAFDFAQNIRRRIEALKIEHSANSAAPYVTVSMGLIAQEARAISGVDALYKQADELLYHSKAAGRNQITQNRLD